MGKFRILVCDGLAETGLALLRSVGEVLNNPKISAEELIEIIADYDALIVRSRTKVNANVIEKTRKLIVIGRAGVGVDNIDVKTAVEHNITVVNTPLAATTAVAEHTLGLMLALARQIPAADSSMKQGKWEKSSLIGSELFGKTLGLLGVGRIGTQVAVLARAFGMSVLALDPYLSEDEIRSRGVTPATFQALLEGSDYISLHLPLTIQTHAMIGQAEFSLMKKGARLVCAARGGVVDEAALRAALDSGSLAGAALDVYETEPQHSSTSSTWSIADHPNVVATPHIGAQTVEAQTRAGIAIAEEVVSVLRGKEPRWKVTKNE